MNKHIIWGFITFLLALTSAVVSAAEHSLSLGLNEGLSSTLTYDIQKDQVGYLWISTRMGVDRYDGYAFKPYQLTEHGNDVLQLEDGKQHHLTTDSHGNLICYTDRGKVFRYKKDSDQFELLYNASALLGRHSLHAVAITDNCLLLGLHDGLYRIDLNSRKVISHRCQKQNIRIIESFIGGTYLIGSDHGLGCLDVALDSCYVLGMDSLDVKTIYHDTDQQRIWVGTNGSGLWEMQLDGNEERQISHFESSIVTQIRPYGDSQLLVGTDGDGLLITSRRILSALEPMAGVNKSDPYKLPGAGVQGMLVDGRNIWLTIFDCGLSLLHPASAVRCLSLPSLQGEYEHRVNDVATDRHGNVWAVYRQAIVKFDPESGCSRVYEFPNSNFLTIQTAFDGTIWAGGYNDGIYHLDPMTGKSTHMGSVDRRVVNSNVFSLFEDNQNRMWVGSQFSPLTCIKPNTVSASFQIPDFSKFEQYDISHINDIGQLDDNTMVIATTDGIVMLDLSTGRTETMLTEIDTTWQGTNFMSCLDTDHSGHIYIGTDGSGLVIYDCNSHRKEKYTTINGLPSNFISSIECEGDSLLWISTEKECIFSFSLHDHSVKTTLTHSHGLSSGGFVQDASAKLPDGRIIFGGKEGIELIDPKALETSRTGLVFGISEIGLGEESRLSYLTHPEILDAPLSNLECIRLPYGERSLRITFSAVDLYHNSDFRFVYRIGDDNYWQSLDEKRTATIYTLPAGKHTMVVRCLRGYDIVAEKVIKLEVEQTPWLSTFAICLYILLAIVLLGSVLITIVKAIQHSSSEEKIRFFNSVAHDIRTPLSLVSTPLSDLEPYISPQAPPTLLPLIKRNIKHLNDVVNQLSLFNNGQNRHLNLVSVQLCDFISALSESYQPLATHKNLYFEIETPEKPLWVYADVGILQRVIDNLLGNAFKFTNEGGIRVGVREQGHTGIIEVSDTGIGMSESTKRKLFHHFFRGDNAVNDHIPGFGLGMMYAFQAVKMMQGHMSCQSQEGKGTVFSLQLSMAPVGEARQYLFDDHTDDLCSNTTAKNPYSGYRYDILVVDDNEELLSYMKQKLSEEFNVSSASCVDDACLMIEKHYPDLIISDVLMPGKRGDDWCRQLKTDISTSHIPIILLTANSDYQSQLQGLTMGADHYIIKPFDVNILMQKIRNIFNARRKMQAYYMQSMTLRDEKGPAERDVPIAEMDGNLDKQFIQRLFLLMDKYIEQPDLNVEQLATEMAVSHTLFYEKVNKLLGVPPASLIRSCRMKKAKSLLMEGTHTVSEVSIMCGFPDPKNFSTAFKKFYGVSPSKIG